MKMLLTPHVIVRYVISAAFAIALGSSYAHAAGPFDELAAMLPGDANAIVALHVEKILDSQLGKAEGWRESYTSRFEAGPLKVPPRATEYLLAAEFELGSMSPQWEAAVFNVSTNPTTEEVRRVTQGRLDTIEGLPAVAIGNEAYVLRFGDQRFGLLRPANRQQAARWAASVRQASERLSPYLTQALSYSDNVGTEIILALDLTNTLHPEMVRERVRKSKLTSEVSATEDQLVTMLSSVRGVTFGVRVTDRMSGRLRVDFGEDVTPLAPVARSLILNLLAQSGASIPDLASWQNDSEGTRLSLRGSLTPDGLRRVLSLIHVDGSVMSEGAAAEPEAEAVQTPEPPKPGLGAPDAAATARNTAQSQRATRRYFRQIDAHLKNLGNPRTTNYSQVALWMRNYSRRIQSMSTRSVDPDVVELGQHVAATLEKAVTDLYGISQEAESRAAAVGSPLRVRVGAQPTLNNVNFGGMLLQQYVPVAAAEIDPGAIAQRNVIAEQANSAAVQVAQQSVAELYSEVERMRGVLNERYGGGF